MAPDIDTYLQVVLGNEFFGGSWFDWFDWVREWWNVKDDSHMLFLIYEWTVANHREAIKRVATFLGKDCTPSLLAKIQERTSFSFMPKHPMSNFSTIEGSFTINY